MAFSHGSKAKAYINGYDLTSYFKSASAEGMRDMAESSAWGATNKAYIPGLGDGSLSFDGMFDGSASAVDDRLNTALTATTPAVVVYEPVTEALGSVAYGYSADESTYDAAAPVADIVSVAAEFQSSVGRERMLVHAVLAQVSANGNGTAIDNAASSAAGGRAYLQVTQSSGGNLVVKVQHSPDNSVWADLITFTTAAAITAERKTVTGTVDRYTRSLHTISAGTATFWMGFGRK